MKKCTRCKEMKAVECFSRDRNRKDGHNPHCKECCRSYQQELQKDQTFRDRVNEKHRERRLMNRGHALVKAAGRRSARVGIPFDLDGHIADIQDRIDAGFCELTGIPFNLAGGRTFDSPSIDRIIPSEGYVYSNVRIICDGMNTALGNWGEEILYAAVTSWIDKRKREGTGAIGANAEIPSGDNRQASIDVV